MNFGFGLIFYYFFGCNFVLILGEILEEIVMVSRIFVKMEGYDLIFGMDFRISMEEQLKGKNIEANITQASSPV